MTALVGSDVMASLAEAIVISDRMPAKGPQSAQIACLKDLAAKGRLPASGVYDRPGCGAPSPRSENGAFHPSTAAPERAGYRCGIERQRLLLDQEAGP